MKGCATLSGFVMISWSIVTMHEGGRRVGLRDPLVIPCTVDGGVSSKPRGMSKVVDDLDVIAVLVIYSMVVDDTLSIETIFHEGKSDEGKYRC